MEEIQGMEQRAAELAQQAADAEALEGTIDDVVARCACRSTGVLCLPTALTRHAS